MNYSFSESNSLYTGLNSSGWVKPATWTQYVVYVTTPVGQDLEMFFGGVTSGATSLFDTASDRHVLTPSATGLTITSTSGGSTYNWTSEASGFNRNDTNYTYSITGTVTIYYAGSVSTQPNQVFRDGSRLALAASKAALATGQWWWDSVNSRIYLFDNPSGHTIEASQRNYGVYASGKPYVTLTGLTVQMANEHGVYLTGASNNSIVDHLQTLNNFLNGFWLTSGTNSTEVRYTTSAYNGDMGFQLSDATPILFHNNAGHNNCLLTAKVAPSYCAGVYASGTSTNFTIEYNTMYSNGWDPTDVADGKGIWFDVAGGGTVAYNLVYSNMSSGVRFESTNSGINAYHNISYSNGGGGGLARGFEVLPSSTGCAGNVNLFNNVSYGNQEAGFAVGTNTFCNGGVGIQVENVVLENNISVGNALDLEATFGGENDGVMGTGNVYLYNSFGAAASNFIEWGAGTNDMSPVPVYYSTYAAWEAATGNCGTTGCSHSTEAAPAFYNASAGQFWLTSGSPGISAGTNLGSPYNIGLMPGSSWPNSVLTGDQNSYGTEWEVGAYIFTGQIVQ